MWELQCNTIASLFFKFHPVLLIFWNSSLKFDMKTKELRTLLNTLS